MYILEENVKNDQKFRSDQQILLDEICFVHFKVVLSKYLFFNSLFRSKLIIKNFIKSDNKFPCKANLSLLSLPY